MMADVVWVLGDIKVVYKNHRYIKVKKDNNELYEGWMRSDFKTHKNVAVFDSRIFTLPDGQEVEMPNTLKELN